MEATLESEGSLILPMPALVEAYSVLTRMPVPFRLSPADASRALQTSLQGVSRLASLSDEASWPFLADLAQSRAIGRAVYDFQIIACAIKAGAKQIITFNVRDFERLKPEGLKIINPLAVAS